MIDQRLQPGTDDPEQPVAQWQAEPPFTASGCSTAFVIAAKALLRQWMTKHAGHYRPGGWDYDKEGAQLVQDTADLLGVQDPWKQ